MQATMMEIRKRNLYAAASVINFLFFHFGKTTSIAVQFFLLYKENILILTKFDLPKSLSYGKELHPFTHVCKFLF